MKFNPFNRKIGLALGGGAAKGIAHIGVLKAIEENNALDKNTNKIPRDLLGLLFCCYLSQLHEGRVIVQGSVRSSYRYLLQFPHARSDEHNTGLA